MATIIREYVPERTRSDNSGLAFLLGVILLLVVGFLLLYYGLPAIRSGGTTINVPRNFDININRQMINRQMK